MPPGSPSIERMTRQRLHDVLESCQSIAIYTAGLDFAAYQAGPMVRDAVERRLGIIGEALNRAVELSPELEDRVPDLREIIGLRNRLIHGYRAVDDRIIWDAIQDEMPPLEASVAALLGERGLG
jgi:uncharacterized protein with HEPN domain